MADQPVHPLAFPDNKSGALGMSAGDRVLCSGYPGTVSEFLSDGDALVALDNGAFVTVKWRCLQLEKVYD